MDRGNSGTDAPARVREYYRALDEHDYDALAALLAPAFVQERPDLTLAGRDRFVQFMREERPRTDTTHAVDAVYVAASASGGDGATGGQVEVAARGRLRTGNGETMTRFVDVFSLGDDGFERLDTYTQ